MSNVRVTYSGLISFLVGLSSVFTGLIFILIVTRKLSPEDFGTWALIGSIIGYIVISERIISYWTTRQIARGENVGKTSVTSSLLFVIGATLMYLLIVLVFPKDSNVNIQSMMLGIVLIPAHYLSQTFTGINLGHKPHAVSIGLLIFEISKVPAALVFVYFAQLGLDGAILALLIAFIIRIIVQIKFAKSKISNPFNLSVLKNWIRLSWISIYSSATKLIISFDILLYSLITGSVLGVAYYAASFTIASLVAHSALISQALAPKLLAHGDHKHIGENLTLMLYFAIPLLAISILFAKPALFALNPIYQDAWIIVIFLSIRMFLLIINNTLRRILESIETVDLKLDQNFSIFVKSKLFTIPTARYINSIIFLFSLSIMLFLFMGTETDELELVTWWVILSLGFEIPFFIFLMIIFSRNVKTSFSFSPITKYVTATLIFSFVFYLTSDLIINYEQSIFEYLPSLILELSICVLIYLGTTFLIDKKTKTLFRAIIIEAKQFKRNSGIE